MEDIPSQPTIAEFDAMVESRENLLRTGTSAAEFFLTHTQRDVDTCEIIVNPNNPITPEVALRYIEDFRALGGVEFDSGDIQSATGLSKSEVNHFVVIMDDMISRKPSS